MNTASEFPDALALTSLENYALKNDINILAISDDAAWINYCENSDNLYAIKKYYKNPRELLLDCIQAFKNLDTSIASLTNNISTLISTSSDIHNTLKKCIEEYLQNNVDCLTPYCDSAYQYDYEVDDIDFNLPKVYLESIDNGEVTLYCSLRAYICGYVTFEEYIWDKENNESILIDKKNKNQDKEVTFDITITAKIIEHDLNNIKIVECDISPEDIEIDFGAI